MGGFEDRVAELKINKNDETMGIYSLAYLDAAARVFAHGVCDFAPYPGMFCLRHGLELFVKQVSVYQALEMRDKALLYQTGHGLLGGWRAVSQHVLETCCRHNTGFSDDVSEGDIEELHDLIEQLHSMDPKGTLFRYPEEFGKDKGRVDTHFPADRVNLNDWRGTAERTLNTCQRVEYCLSERVPEYAWGHGQSLYDVVLAMPQSAKL